ncbi:excisionase family DNA-binding protein [Niallia sp. Krafla_26]|uniref:excisionase family DNA-binding protein n=1 Tax=Niallia sp. Krafla_26 TaxID=3064703 RepID=UPI003D16B4D4
MYLTVKETAEYLSLPESTIQKLILQGKIRAVPDGKGEYLLSKEQFTTHLRQMEKYKEFLQEYYSEPIPEDRDIKDED